MARCHVGNLPQPGDEVLDVGLFPFADGGPEGGEGCSAVVDADVALGQDVRVGDDQCGGGLAPLVAASLLAGQQCGQQAAMKRPPGVALEGGEHRFGDLRPGLHGS
jgi:hypothetical protein